MTASGAAETMDGVVGLDVEWESGGGDFRGNLKVLSSFPTASGLGLLGRPSSTSRGKLASLLCRLSLGPAPISSDPFREVEGRSSEPLLLLLLEPAEPLAAGPVMLILAIVSGEGDRRSPSGASVMGDDGAEEVNGREERLRGSGRLNGAGAGSACVI